jgi:hypothetical protein
MRRTITNEIWEQIKTAYASGLGLREIARNTGIPEGTVLARAKREGWTQQIQNAKTLVKHEDSALAVTPSEAVAMSMQRRGERHVERIAGVSERGVDHIETMNGPEILNSVLRSGNHSSGKAFHRSHLKHSTTSDSEDGCAVRPARNHT